MKTRFGQNPMYACRLVLLFHSLTYTEFEGVASIEFWEFEVELKCEKDNLNILTVSGFSTEEEAIAYLDKLKTAFHWLMLDRGITTEAELRIDEIQRHSNVMDGCSFKSIAGKPSSHIYKIPYGFIHTRMLGGESIVGAPIVLDGLRAGLDIATRIIPESDKRLSLSLDLYRSSTLQANLKSRFTMLITSIECLSPTEMRDEWEIHLINKFIGEVKTYNPPSGSTDLPDKVNEKKYALIGGLDRLKTKSIWQNIRQEITQVYQDSEEGCRSIEIVQRSLKQRHRIVHGGQAVTQEEVNDLDTVLKNLLIYRITSLPKRQLLEDSF
ncbi:hypothetical protein [Synechococcus sp. MW101C3]|uniref:hypothetical protein n=1 Tax=Synechococcus sp. MW101C3 TaxID=210768 RepID=UPI001181B693|nr:hypothetical protein [Synechococcus sp. MW101C3]